MSRDRLADVLAATPVVDLPAPSPEMGALCGLTPDDFHALLMDLLPRGVAWPRDPITVLWRFWLTPAFIYALVHASDCKLLAEAFPCGATELLPEWLAMVGLPDECTAEWPVPVTVQRTLICAKLAARGGQSIAYFVALAAAYGFTISIIEHVPWAVGCMPLCTETFIGVPPYWWTVSIANLPVSFVTVGCWHLCDPLFTVLGADLLECIIRRAAPAYTIVTFSYYTERPPAIWNRGRWQFDAWTKE